VYHPGRYLAEEEFAISGLIVVEPDEKARLLEQEATILKEAADAYPGVVIAMENARPYLHHSPYCYAEIPRELKKQVDAINRENVRITLDFGHLHMTSRFFGFDALDELGQLSHLIAHCHVHDNFGDSVNFSEKMQTHLIPFGKGDAHMPVGWGNIPFEAYFHKIIDEFNGILICELRGRYFESTGESVRNLADILRGIGAGSRIAGLSVA
jgi:sugar phosphate isomerase/epimerase